MMPRWSRLIPLPALALMLAGAPVQPAGADALESSLRHLQRAVVPQRDGSHLRLLLSLRQLRDPTLRPLFHQLTQHADWQIQVHAILGLAEIDEDGRADPWLITRADPIAQEQVIPNALDMGLLGSEEIDELLAWPDLSGLGRVMLLGEFLINDRDVDTKALARLARSTDDQIRGMASCFLAQSGDRSAFSSFQLRLDSLDEPYRRMRTLWLFDVIRQYRITALLDWVREVVEQPEADDDIVYWGVFTILKLDTEQGIPLWRRFLGDAPTHRQRVRYALLLMQTGSQVPASAYDRLDAEDPLLQHMVRAGKAVSLGADASQPLIELLDLGHLKSADWALTTLETLPKDQARAVYLHLIDAVEADHPARAERITLAKLASAELFQIDPRALEERLLAADDDSVTQQAIVLGLLDVHSPAAGKAAGKLRRIGSGRADSLALLLVAKHAESLPDEDLRQLGLIGAGGGRLGDGLQVQAAWLYLKHSGHLGTALSRVLADR